jgi:two-component system phosphate regulon response regulator PhoB
MTTILIVEDERPIRQLLSFVLGSAGHETRETADAMSAMNEVARRCPDLTLLDWRLPDMEGIRLVRLWRAEERTARMPVIMLSARGEESDRVAGLKAGADDYIVKPFGREELLARVQAVLRRAGSSRAAGSDVRELNGLKVDTRSLRVVANERSVLISPIEFRLLNLFMMSPDRALTRAQIMDRVWPANAYVDERTVDVHVRRLRRALQPTGHDGLIETVRGVGYRLTSPRPGTPATGESRRPELPRHVEPARNPA